MLNTKTVILEYDDFHWKSPENCLSTINTFISKYPAIRISLFTPPIHSGLHLSDNPIWCDEVRKLIQSNNIRLAVHGTYHSQEEYKYKSVEDVINSIKKSEEEFKDSNLPYIKVFRGPHWGINENTYSALESVGYTHIYTHQDYINLIDKFKIKSIIYNWNLKDDAPTNSNILIGHGHTHNVCQNGISETFNRVSNVIDMYNPQFKFVNEI